MKCNIEAEVVKADIPLLLSKESLKRAETVLDLSNDSATMFKQPVDLEFTSSEKTDSNNIGDSDTVNIDTLLQRDVNNQNSVDRDAVAESDSSDDDGVRDLGEQAQARAETDQQTVIVLKPGQSVQYLDRDSGDIVVGRILGRAGKATAGEKGSVDLSRVDDLETTIDSEDVAREQDESVMKLEGVSFDDAKCGELNSWKKNQVYIEIPDMGQKCISTRWICTLKETDIGIVPKARVKSVMLDLGANISRVDPAVFYWINSDNQVIGILASHVDDFIGVELHILRNPSSTKSGRHFVLYAGRRDIGFSGWCDNCIFLSTLYMELTKGVSQPSEVLPITCVVDNHSLYGAIKSTKFVADKRLRLEISNIKELLKTKQVREVCWTNTKEQLADCLTKKGFGELDDDAFGSDSSITEQFGTHEQKNDSRESRPSVDEQVVQEKAQLSREVPEVRPRSVENQPCPSLRHTETNNNNWKQPWDDDSATEVPNSPQMSDWVRKRSEEYREAKEKKSESDLSKPEEIEPATVVHIYNQRPPSPKYERPQPSPRHERRPSSPDQERPQEEVEVIEKPTIRVSKSPAQMVAPPTPVLEEESETDESSEEESEEEEDKHLTLPLSQETPPPPLPKQGPPPLPKMGPPPLIKTDGDVSTFQPPDILQRWQRKSRTQLTYDDLDSDLNNAEKRMSITFPLEPENKAQPDSSKSVRDDMVLNRANRDYEATLPEQIVPDQKKREFNVEEDLKKMQSWEVKQQQQREPTKEFQSVAEFSVGKEGLERDRRRLNDQYQSDIDQAELSRKQNEQKDNKILEPEMERAKGIEIRHHQRRSQHNFSETPKSPTHPTSPDEKPQSSLQALTIKLASPVQGRPLQMDNSSESVSRYINDIKFLVHFEEIDHAEALERERERIREQEHRRLEEEKRRWEAEENQRMREREEKLRQQEEQLEKERQHLREEQERMQREREEFERREWEEQEKRRAQMHSKPVPQTRKTNSSQQTLPHQGPKAHRDPRPLTTHHVPWKVHRHFKHPLLSTQIKVIHPEN
ncbi:hypothetical protein ScPMuIL_011538 [Solemya velum]